MGLMLLAAASSSRFFIRAMFINNPILCNLRYDDGQVSSG